MPAFAKTSGSVWDALVIAYKRAFKGAHIEKVGFAREVVDAITGPAAKDRRKPREDIEYNFTALLSHLSEVLDDADRRENSQRNQNRLSRVIAGFERDHPDGVLKRRARALVRELELALDDSDASDHVRVELTAIQRDFDLDGDLSGSMSAFAEFREALRKLDVLQRTAGQETAHSAVRDRTT